MKKLKMGLIGCGGMMKSHMMGVEQVKNVEFVAVCDVIRERAEDMATILNNPFITTDWREMADKVDGVLIALPHDLHFECGMFFAKNRKHVLMEKPLCNTEEECRTLIDTCREMGVTLMCAYPVPHYPAIKKLKELIDSGEYGQIMQFSIWTEQYTPVDSFPWAGTARLGGGQLFSHGCHYVDILLRMLGTPVKGYHVGTRNGTPWLLREGTSAMVLKFENGALGYHGATWGARGSRLGYDFQIQTERGLLEFSKRREGGSILLYDSIDVHKPGVDEKSSYKVIWRAPEVKGNTKFTHYEIDHFADCVMNGKTPVTDGETALKSLRLIWKLYDGERLDFVPDLRDCAYTEEEMENYARYVKESDD